MKKVILLFIFILCIGSAIGVYLWFHGITKKIFIPHFQGASAPVNSIQKDLNDKKPIDLVLLGYGGGNHDGAYLTDSIIAVHIDPKIKKVLLISVPRDIWIKIPTNGADGGYAKINAAYEDGLDDTDFPNKQTQFTGQDGGGRLAEYMISQVTGLPITYFVGMDFSGFKHTIDTLGGVDINVQPAFDDYEYPVDGMADASCGFSTDEIASLSAQIASGSASELDAFPCRFEHIHFSQGQQHMNGTVALTYVRSRHSLQDGTDFGRSKRQRNLLVAVKQKIFSAGFIPQIVPFMSSLGDDLRTDMSLDDVKTFIQNSSVLNTYQIENLAITDQNYLVDAVSSDGQDILEPKDGKDNWTTVHNWITSEISGKPQPVAAIVEVENGTQTTGLAGTATTNLKNAGVQVLDPVNAATQNNQKTTIAVYDKNVSSSDLAKMKKEFHVNTVTYATPTQNTFNVLVVIGNDYTNQTTVSLSTTP